jgi:polyisoprenoid-binding protein YceI
MHDLNQWWKRQMQHWIRGLVAAAATLYAMALPAAEYLIDSSGAHASVNFKFDHLGIGRITGSFKKFSGTFYYDSASPTMAWVKVKIDVASLDSNQQTRDRTIRSSQFLDVEQFPQASFESSSTAVSESGELRIFGNLTLHGITRKIEMQGRKIGELTDQWGRHRIGFEASVVLNTQDFEMTFPPSNRVLMELYVEGVRKPAPR